MRQNRRIVLSFILGITVFVLLGLVSLPFSFQHDQLSLGIVFCLLIVFTTAFGVPLAGGIVSLLPMTTVAACLVVGPEVAGWAAYIGALLVALVRQVFSRQFNARMGDHLLQNWSIGSANAGIQALSILGSGLLYRTMQGEIPLQQNNISILVPLLLLAVGYLSINFIIVAFFMVARSREAFTLYLRSLPSLIYLEGGPLIFSPLVAIVYSRLGWWMFILLILVFIVASLIARNLAQAASRLERRVKELDSLQAVGRVLSSSLDVNKILEAIYTQASALMPVQSFYVALYNPEEDEVSFPLSMENGDVTHWRTRKAGQGITEYIIRNKHPLLFPNRVSERLQELGIEAVGQMAQSWLGVPILAGDQVLGVVTVQSYTDADVYDLSHQEILSTISAQAAVAIQNARLYAKTDEALTRRVREFDSILRTSADGILLLDLENNIVEANRALAEMTSARQMELIGINILDSLDDTRAPFIESLGYQIDDFDADCWSLLEKEADQKRLLVNLPEKPERSYERILAPVRNRTGELAGWLLIFRDRTEEAELEKLKEDMIHMMVHDLRSPLTSIIGSLKLIEQRINLGESQDVSELLSIAASGGNRMIHLVNDLLDISKMEDGLMPVNRRPVALDVFLENCAAQLTPLAVDAKINLQVDVEPGLPELSIDVDQMTRVLNNLLDNAIKFTPDGGNVKLWVKREPLSVLPSVLIGISDTGPGLSTEAQGRLFKKFQRISSVQGRRSGTGLGLYFCKLAVESLDGKIWVESEIGKGSTFIIRLPLV
jgi:NtrC-family two-component system sensor histidine kinase KinB